jgi:hypothetical protein
MEYISLFNLQNQYPSINNYIKQATGNVKLEGLYISDPKYYELFVRNNGNVNSVEYKYNSIIFDKPDLSLDNVVIVPKTSFNFVLCVKANKSDTVPKYFTSDQFYKKLKSSAADGNPYFIGRALDKQFLIEYNLEECVKIVKDLLKNETKNNVTLGNHIFIKSDNSIDYNKLVQYIDWLVSSVSPDDSLNGGVLKAEKLINSDFKVKKLEINPLPKSEAAGGGSTSSGNTNNSGGGYGGGSSYDTTPSSGTFTRDTNDGSGGGSGSGRGGSSDGGSGNTSGGNTAGGLGMGDGRGPYESGFDTSSGDFNSINNMG